MAWGLRCLELAVGCLVILGYLPVLIFITVLGLTICGHPSVSPCKMALASLGCELLIGKTRGWKKLGNKSRLTQSTDSYSGIKSGEVDLYVLT